jgi:hypothetical protein
MILLLELLFMDVSVRVYQVVRVSLSLSPLADGEERSFACSDARRWNFSTYLLFLLFLLACFYLLLKKKFLMGPLWLLAF